MPVTSVRLPIVLCALVASVAVTAAQAPPPLLTPTSDADHPFIVRQQTDRVRYEADGTRVRRVSRDVLIQSPAGRAPSRRTVAWNARSGSPASAHLCPTTNC